MMPFIVKNAASSRDEIVRPDQRVLVQEEARRDRDACTVERPAAEPPHQRA